MAGRGPDSVRAFLGSLGQENHTLAHTCIPVYVQVVEVLSLIPTC